MSFRIISAVVVGLGLVTASQGAFAKGDTSTWSGWASHKLSHAAKSVTGSTRAQRAQKAADKGAQAEADAAAVAQ